MAETCIRQANKTSSPPSFSTGSRHFDVNVQRCILKCDKAVAPELWSKWRHCSETEDGSNLALLDIEGAMHTMSIVETSVAVVPADVPMESTRSRTVHMLNHVLAHMVGAGIHNW